MDKHRAMFDRHAAALKRFYAQLTPTQQKAFDALHDVQWRAPWNDAAKHWATLR